MSDTGSTTAVGASSSITGLAVGDFESWKVRTSAGMVYDFPDTESILQWLESRATLAGLEASRDGGMSFKGIRDFPELAGAEARGLSGAGVRSIAPASSSITGSLPTAGTLPPRPRKETTGAPASAGAKPTSEKKKRVPRTPKPRRSRSAESDESSGKIGRIILLAVLLLASGVGALAYFASQREATLPKTPAGQKMAYVLDLMNGAAERMSEAEVGLNFAPSFTEKVPAPTLIDEFEYWLHRYPSYDLLRVQRGSSDTNLEIVVDTPLQDQGLILIEVEPTPPHKIVALRIEPYR